MFKKIAVIILTYNSDKIIKKTIKAATNPLGSAMEGVKDTAKDIASSMTDLDPSSETAKLGDQKIERVENAKKIHAATARATADRKASEAEEALKRAEKYEAELAPNPTKES